MSAVRAAHLDRSGARPPISFPAVGAAGEPWVLALDAGASSAEGRAAIAAGLGKADVGRFGWLVLHTCRRVEVVGAGPRPAPHALADLTGAADAASMALHTGEAAARRLARLATGLESAVVGEDQVLGQVRRLRREAASVARVDAKVIRLVDLAIAIGRRARAEQPRAERSLAERGLAWLGARRDLSGARLLVVGRGPIGAEAARLARSSGASVTIASRRAGRQWSAPLAHLSLQQASAAIAEVDLVVVALAGPWSELLVGGLARDRLPLVVDLSAPSAIPGPVRAILGARVATLDDLAADQGDDEAIATPYRHHAELLVDEAVTAWSRAAQPGGAAPFAGLRDAAESRCSASLQRLWRRLPELDDRQRALVEQHARQLVAAMLHEPTIRLRGAAGGLGVATDMHDLGA